MAAFASPTYPALAAALLSGTLVGCVSVGPDHRSPCVGLPDAWSRSATKDLSGRDPGLVRWWKGFQDPALSALVERSRQASPTLQAAAERIVEARAQRGIAASQGLPRVGADGSITRQRSSEKLGGPAAPDNRATVYQTGFDAGWEIDLFESASRSYGFGPSFRWQIFSSGRIRNAIRVEESRAKQALSQYENTVLLAVEEVETSMAQIAYERERLTDLGRAVAAARETVALVKENYENGLVSFQNVLDAERTRFSAEDAEAFSRGQIARSYIALYKALGGGTPTELMPESGSRLDKASASSNSAVSRGPAGPDDDRRGA